MGSPFDAAMRAADAVIDVVMGEPFLVTLVAAKAEPDGDVNAALGPAMARAAMPVTMTYQEVGTDYYPAARGKAGNGAQRMVGARVMLSVLACRLDFPITAGDLALRERTGIRYRIAEVKTDDAGRIWLPATVER